MTKYIVFLLLAIAATSHAAPGDKTAPASTAFTTFSSPNGKAKATKAKDTVQIKGEGATTVSITGKTVNISTPVQVQTDWTATDGPAKILNQPAETCVGRLSWDGIDGTQIHYVSGSPAADLGVIKDFAIDSASWNFYRKEGSPAAWILKGNLIGPANSLAIGTITTLAYTDPATCTITGTSPNQVLSCGFPQGIPGPPAALSRGGIVLELSESDDTILYLQPATDSPTVGGLVINDYGSNAAIIIQNGRLEYRDTSGVVWAKLDRAAGTVATYDTSGNIAAKMDRAGVVTSKQLVLQ